MNSLEKKLDEWFRTQRKVFAMAHSGHNVGMIQPVRHGWNGPSIDGLGYLECFDCDERSNGPDLHYEVTEKGITVSMHPPK